MRCWWPDLHLDLVRVRRYVSVECVGQRILCCGRTFHHTRFSYTFRVDSTWEFHGSPTFCDCSHTIIQLSSQLSLVCVGGRGSMKSELRENKVKQVCMPVSKMMKLLRTKHCA